MRRLLVTVSLAALAIAGALPEALAYLKAGPNMAGPGHHRLKVPGGPPLDGLPTQAVAYSFRKLRTAYAGNAKRIRRASDNLELDIGFLGASWNEAAAAAHCAETNCFLVTDYDQSGQARNAFRPTPAEQPVLVFGCQNSLPCMRTTVGLQLLNTATGITPTAPVSISAVANRNAGTGQCYFGYQYDGTNYISGTPAVANQWQLAGGLGGSIVAPAADNAWHAAAGVIAGASSVFRLDSTEVTGTVTASTPPTTYVSIWGSASTTCSVGEVIIWDGYALSATERSALTANQRSFWGF